MHRFRVQIFGCVYIIQVYEPRDPYLVPDVTFITEGVNPAMSCAFFCRNGRWVEKPWGNTEFGGAIRDDIKHVMTLLLAQADKESSFGRTKVLS